MKVLEVLAIVAGGFTGIAILGAIFGALLVLACHSFNRLVGAPGRRVFGPEEASEAKAADAIHAESSAQASPISADVVDPNAANPYRPPLAIDANSPAPNLDDFANDGVLPPAWLKAWEMGIAIGLCTVLLYWTIIGPWFITAAICSARLPTSYGRGLGVSAILYGYILLLLLSLIVMLAVACIYSGPLQIHP